MSRNPCKAVSLKIPSTTQIIVANNEKITIEEIGNTNLDVFVNHTSRRVQVSDIFYAPRLTSNLLSVRKIIEKSHIVTFHKKGCQIRDAARELKATATLTNGMYKLDQPLAEAKTASTLDNGELWHKRLGHLHSKAMEFLRNGLVTGLHYKYSSPCTICLKGKQKKTLFREVA